MKFTNKCVIIIYLLHVGVQWSFWSGITSTVYLILLFSLLFPACPFWDGLCLLGSCWQIVTPARRRQKLRIGFVLPYESLW
jgi:hypothetical protein